MRLRFALGLAVLVLTMSAVPMPAQSFQIDAAIPFAFVVDSQTMPAGQYAFTGLTTRGVVSIWNKDTNQLSAATYHPGYKPPKEEWGKVTLVFQRYGQTYFLSEIRNGTGSATYLFRESPVEHEHRRASSASQAPSATVALVARAAR